MTSVYGKASDIVTTRDYELTCFGESNPNIFLIFATLALAWRDLRTGDGLL